MKHNLVSKIIELGKKNESPVIIEALIENQLKLDTNNIELLIRLSLLELEPPIADYDKSITCLKKILSIDKNNIYALLITAYIYDNCLGGIDEFLFKQITSIQTKNNELKSMLKYVASWFYDHKNIKNKTQLLQESIKYCSNHVLNYVKLADLYFQQGRNEEANILIENALKNVKKIYSNKEIIESDSTDVTEFLNERIKGIHLTNLNFELIQKKKLI